MGNNIGVEYSSDYILIVSNCNTEEFKVIGLDSDNPKIKSFDTWNDGLTNEEVEKAIREVLSGEKYDIDYELEKYRSSRLWAVNDYNEKL